MSTPTAPSRYRRLARGTIAMVIRCSLWLNDDHLLSVKSTGYTEEYSRVYLKDLKGIVAQRTKTWLVGNLILGALLALFSWGILATDDLFSGGTIALMIFATPLLILFLYHLLLGPTCKASLLTPLGPVDIPALTRSRQVTRLLRELRPLIATRQGSMPRSELLARYDAERAASSTASAAPVP